MSQNLKAKTPQSNLNNVSLRQEMNQTIFDMVRNSALEYPIPDQYPNGLFGKKLIKP